MRRILLSAALLLLSLGIGAAPQEGNGWTRSQVAPGITYYVFSGLDALSGAHQQVFVLDWDTANPSYALRYTWSEQQNVTSAIFLRENAVAALNAAYEPESTVVKVDGQYHSCMPKDTVMTTPVPNWKSEAAVYTDASGRRLRIGFDGRDLSIAQQRDFYAASPWENIFSSAPMLIDDYAPVGAFFVDSTLTSAQLKQYNYEDPVRHQGVRHPRTAVALTEDGHFLMVAVDGRRKGVSEGMTARELTRFLERHFHPRYALNMDGGGSTTLCIRGEGDPQTHVVNYPTDNKQYDHAGERKLFSHFCLVEVPAQDGWLQRPLGFGGRYTLEEAVVLSRHNLRSPFSGRGSALSRITPHQWFAWTSEPGELSRKGAVLESLMGRYFSDWMTAEGLFEKDAVPAPGQVRFYANSVQRTVATARFFASAFLPMADIPVEHPYPLGTMDPVFNPVFHRDDAAFVSSATTEIRRFCKRSVLDQLQVLEEVLDMQDSPAAANDSSCFRIQNTGVLVRLGEEPGLTGDIRMAVSAADALTLQYYEEPDELAASFGHPLTRAQREAIFDVTDWYQEALFSPPMVARDLAEPLLRTLLAELEAPGRKFSFLCGHDSNITSVLSALGAEPYSLPDVLMKKAPIGGKLVIGKWKGADGLTYADLHLVYASDAQVRSAAYLTPDNPPLAYPIALQGLTANADGLYLLSDLVARFRAALAAITVL